MRTGRMGGRNRCRFVINLHHGSRAPKSISSPLSYSELSETPSLPSQLVFRSLVTVAVSNAFDGKCIVVEKTMHQAFCRLAAANIRPTNCSNKTLWS